MAERTIRKRRGADIVSVIRAGEPAPNDAGEPITDVEPDAVEPDGPIVAATIDDYDVDTTGNTDGNFVDPATGSGSGADSGTRRRTRSDAGTRRGSRRSRTSATETTNSVANLLFTCHLGISAMLHSEVFAITEQESEELAKAVTKVSQLYDIPVIGEKALAWMNLAMVGGKIYGPRVVAVKLTKKRKDKVVEISANFEQPKAGQVS